MISRLNPIVTFRLDSREHPEWGWDVHVGDIPVNYGMDHDADVREYTESLINSIIDYAKLSPPGSLVSMELLDDPDVRKWDAEIAADRPFPL